MKRRSEPRVLSRIDPVRALVLAGLGLCVAMAAADIAAAFRTPQDWSRLLGLIGLATIGAYALVLVLGICLLVLALLDSPRLSAGLKYLEGFGRVAWLAVAALILSIIWFYLYSSWQAVLTGAWLQLTFAFSLTAWVALWTAPRRRLFSSWEEPAFALAVFVFPRLVLELRILFAQAWVYRLAVVLGYGLLLVLAVTLYSSRQSRVIQILRQGRDSIGWLRWPLLTLAFCGPLLFYFSTGAQVYIQNPNLRFCLLLVGLILAAVLINRNGERLISIRALLISALALVLASALVKTLFSVSAYPFSMTWSEGDRFYEDSLLFGQHIYNYAGWIVNPYQSPGNYVLPGIFFLVPGLSLSLFRLWNALLLVVPSVLLGWILSQRIRDPYVRIGFALWVTLFFILEAPLHPPFMVAAILVFAFMFSPSWSWRAGSLAVASFYVGLSRWTWIPVTAGWGILIDLLLYFPQRSGSLVRRLTPTLGLAALGFLPGLATAFISRPDFGGGTNLINQQPLLLYRLLPNPTLPLGVLLTAVLYSGPLVVLLIWWMISGRWRLDRLQSLAVWAGLAVFFIGGLAVSAKIGGGGDLHNLDMYLMTLMLVFALGVIHLSGVGPLSSASWPAWAQGALCLLIVMPVYFFSPLPRAAAYDPVLDLTSPQKAQTELGEMLSRVQQASRQGPVLFIDQRQLLTFDYVSHVALVPEYEKKYMMDQALSGNASYFRNYYHDLADQRYRLIVSEVLRTRHTSDAFSAENNAWVDWVSKPTLCFYQPLATYEDINVQLLVPNADISPCGKYLK